MTNLLNILKEEVRKMERNLSMGYISPERKMAYGREMNYSEPAITEDTLPDNSTVYGVFVSCDTADLQFYCANREAARNLQSALDGVVEIEIAGPGKMTGR